MTQSRFREILFAPVHSLVAMAFVVAAAGSVASFSLAESRQFEPVVVSDAWVRQPNLYGSVLGVSTPSTVSWTHLSNMISEGGDLEQVSGSCVGCADAGAHSVQQITGDGYFEFTIAPGAYHYVYAGLNTDTSASTSAIMPFAFEISGVFVSVREQGIYKSDTPFVAGDVFRISSESGVVKYYKNGNLFYTSLTKPVYPLVADVSMQSVGSLLWGGKIAISDTVVASSAPVIVSFTASPTFIAAGQSTRLSWSVTGATSLSIDQGVGMVTGATGETVAPTSTTTYTLTATGEGGTTVSTVTVNVAPVEVPPSTSVCNTVIPQEQFTGCYYNNKNLTSFKFSRVDAYPINFTWGRGSPGRLISSDTFSVAWTGQFNFENGSYVFTTTVDDGVRVYVDGNLIIDKWSDTPGTHTATVSPGAGTHVVRMDYYENRGSAKASLSWSQSAAPPAPTPVISSFTASPASITSGSSTLAWTVSGATSLSINQGVGTVTGTTSKVVTPTATTTYTLTATNNSGSVTASATVTVNPVTPTTITDGYGDTLLATQFNGWFFSQVGDTSAVITYENIADATKTYTQTASRTISRPDAETWLKSTYGTNFTITQPLGFTVNPSTVVTAPGTYRIKSVKLNTSNTNILLGPSAQGTFTVGGTPPSGNATITINSSQRYQTMNGWEAVAQAGALRESSTSTGTTNLDPNFALYKNALFDQAVNDLGLNRLRIELISGSEHPTDYFTQYLNGQITFNQWKSKWYDPINDNTSPTSVNASGFKFSYLDFQMDQVVLPIKQRLEARGEQLFLNMCFVDFAGTSFEHYSNPEEYAELVVEAYKHMQSKYGFVPNTLEMVLEPDNTSFNGTYIGQAMQATASRLVAAGFTPRFIMPSTTSMSSANSYFDAAKAVVGSSFISQYVEELSYHRYTGVSTGALQGIASRASQHGIKTGMLEWIGADHNTLYEDLTVGNVSGWEQYALAYPGGFDDGSIYYSINGTSISIGIKTKWLRHYFKYIRRGAVRIGASSVDEEFKAVAFQNSNGKYVVVVSTLSGGPFSIGGVPAGTYGVMYTVNSTTYNGADIAVGGGANLDANIPGGGVITVYQK